MMVLTTLLCILQMETYFISSGAGLTRETIKHLRRDDLGEISELFAQMILTLQEGTINDHTREILLIYTAYGIQININTMFSLYQYQGFPLM